MNARRLEAELRSRIRGEVRFDDGSRALYATDSSNYRQVPIGVVLPRDEEEVIRTVEVCRDHSVPILARGCGTSLAGQCCNVAVVMDFSRHMNRIVALDPEHRIARVQPGVILDHLRNAAEQHHLTFGPDPASHDRCTIGGMIGNNSCGVHSVMSGKTVDNLASLRILTYDGAQMTVGETSDAELQSIIAGGGRRGEIYAGLRSIRDRFAPLIRSRFPDIPRRVSGYNLDQLLPENGFHVARALVGTESTCALVLEAELQLIDSPKSRVLLTLGYPDVFAAADAVPAILQWKPCGLEGLDDRLIDDCKRKNLNLEGVALLPEGGGWLVVEFGGENREEAVARATDAMRSLRGNTTGIKLYDTAREQQLVWKVRESGLGASAFVPGEKSTWEGWEDSAVAPQKLGNYMRELRHMMDRYGFHGNFYGHFGDGCLHTRISFDLQSPEGIKQYRGFLYEAAELVVKHGGSLSGEHGDGQARGELLPIMFGKELVDAFREFKRLWDPQGKMNPGKVVDAYGADQNLRLGVEYAPAKPHTHFQYEQDDGHFGHAVLRCVGVGKCRREEGGVMCPSFMATRDEAHSTRGRAHLLFEMMRGEVIRDGWRSEEVKHALDLCLSCKGCKTECPVNVDVATYRAEFLSHYYEGRRRPLHAHGFGRIDVWARLASHAPALANLFTQNQLTARVLKAIAGVSQNRKIPRFAKQTFRQWFRHRAAQPGGQTPVLLWPDTFTNHFYPEAGIAATEVLEAAGFAVQLPPDGLCCGRPLYDFGMLDQAKRQLRQILTALQSQIAADIPIVGLEPGCLSVFRDELINLFPKDPEAQKLSRLSFHLSEFLVERMQKPLPWLRGKAIVHGHCHHKSILDWQSEVTLLRGLGLDCEVLDSGCCGMAGHFGFSREHYDLSQQIGERVLLPAVRSAPKEALLIADGFSCREQIAQSTDRRALHLAEVLQLAYKGDRL